MGHPLYGLEHPLGLADGPKCADVALGQSDPTPGLIHERVTLPGLVNLTLYFAAWLPEFLLVTVYQVLHYNKFPKKFNVGSSGIPASSRS